MTKLNITRRTSIMLAIVSVICSLLLWVYVTSTDGDDYEDSFAGVKVVYEGENTMRESRGLVITSRDYTSVKVKITGNRRIISKLEAADLTAVIDLSTITSSGRYTNAYKITYPSGIDTSGLKVSVKTPENITFTVDKLNTKMVPVQGVFNGNPADGFIAEPLEFEPKTVKISGPQNALENVDHAWVEVSREDVDKTLSYESDYVLMNLDGNVIEDNSIVRETATVNVTLPITAIKEVNLMVKVVNGGGAKEENCDYIITPSTITLSGDSNVLEGVNSIDIATIDLSEVESTLTQAYPIVIPNDTEIISGPKDAVLTLSLSGLETKTVSITNFSCTHVTEGYTADVMIDNLTVTLRGPADALSNVSDLNVRAVADLSDFGTTKGILSVPVEIYVDGTQDVGAFGEYRVYVNVSESVAEEAEQAKE